MSLEVTGEKLISGGDDSMIRIWNTNNWTCEQILRAHQVQCADPALPCIVVYWSDTAWLAVTKCWLHLLEFCDV